MYELLENIEKVTYTYLNVTSLDNLKQRAAEKYLAKPKQDLKNKVLIFGQIIGTELGLKFFGTSVYMK